MENNLTSQRSPIDSKVKQSQVNKAETKQYIEILGDTVVPKNLLYSVLISICFSLGGYFLGQVIFPLFAGERMVSSYSLLLGIAGCLMGLVINSRLFKPTRILNEAEATQEDIHEIFKDLQLNPEEEYEMIKKDPVTKKEMEELGIIDKFIGKGD
ncbi:hypothetical protein [Priestia filamentosa]|uniref:hypothetical protein n=1 Tax=Priestia filamentosa TaxID=1402861 RepID=UPI001FD284AF|nr:hypothetical protein [Priestia filamentosa]